MSLRILFIVVSLAAHGAVQADGQAIFAKYCAACHQATGKGIRGAFPALAGNAFVQGAPEPVAAVLLKGRGGMPDFSPTLSDADIAEVVSFVRGAWGNQASAVGAQEVAALRQSLKVPGFAAGQMSNKH